ncbi:hypothetical protein Droror1_Dr00007191, partial [Drosera rotundifolia]
MYRVFQKLKALQQPLNVLHSQSMSDVSFRHGKAREKLYQIQEEFKIKFSEKGRILMQNQVEEVKRLTKVEEEFLKQNLRDSWFKGIDRSS